MKHNFIKVADRRFRRICILILVGGIMFMLGEHHEFFGRVFGMCVGAVADKGCEGIIEKFLGSAVQGADAAEEAAE